jgi:hypothetical protein
MKGTVGTRYPLIFVRVKIQNTIHFKDLREKRGLRLPHIGSRLV